MGIGAFIMFGVKQALKIAVGVVLTVAVFFGVGYSFARAHTHRRT